MIDHFISTLPTKPYCGPKGAHQILDREAALKFPLIQFNHPNYRHWIGVDIDQKFGGIAWEDCGLEPNLIMQNRDESGHCHFLYGLEKPMVISETYPYTNATRYFAAITRGLTHAVGGDYGYRGNLIKNPCHEKWRAMVVRKRLYTLADIRPHVEMNISIDKIRADSLGRNCMLFDTLRFWAYDEVTRLRECNALSAMAFHADVMQQARMINAQFTYRLPESEVRSTTKSVANYCLKKYRGRRRMVGVMALDRSLPLETRQAMAAKRTHTKQKASTRESIRDAVKLLGINATQKQIASHTDLSIRTVATYLGGIKEAVRFEREVEAANERMAA